LGTFYMNLGNVSWIERQHGCSSASSLTGATMRRKRRS
jgi:hypothetical protein